MIFMIVCFQKMVLQTGGLNLPVGGAPFEETPAKVLCLTEVYFHTVLSTMSLFSYFYLQYFPDIPVFLEGRGKHVVVLFVEPKLIISREI